MFPTSNTNTIVYKIDNQRKRDEAYVRLFQFY